MRAAQSGTDDYAAVILAAGYSCGMGRLKATLPLAGKTVAERVISIFRANRIEEVVVVLGHRSREISPLLRSSGVRTVINRRYARGIFSSLQAGLSQIDRSKKGFFVLPVDIPLVRPQTIAALIERAQVERGKVLHPCCYGLRGHPPLIPMSLAGHIIASEGRGGLRGFLSERREPAAEVEVADRYVLFDINTPPDYERLLHRFQSYDVPSPLECGAILQGIAHVPGALLRHSRMVARLAGRLGERCVEAGVPLDRKLLRAAAMLHDIAKGRHDHARAGAARLREMGFPRVGKIVESHHDLRFSLGAAPGEAEILYLADKLIAGDAVVELERRFSGSMKRYGDSPEALRNIRRRLDTAVRIKNELERITGDSLQRLYDPVLRGEKRSR